MNFEEAKREKKELEESNKIHSAKLNTFEKNAMGMTPDHIRRTSEWQQAKQDFNQSFARLRNFNSWYVKTFKKEIQADRRKRFTS
ncbi:hypothetical protein CN918_29165 [Priestia megaterium]|nr:hypothetical protein CN918_29165 [Priestia megaterium]